MKVEEVLEKKCLLCPVIERVFAFEDLLPALDYMSKGLHFGKICIKH